MHDSNIEMQPVLQQGRNNLNQDNLSPFEPICDDSIEKSEDHHEESMDAEKKVAKEAKTEHRSTANSQSCQPLKTADQPTLQGLFRANPRNLEDMEGRNGISIHRPFHQDPKCLLTVTGRPQEGELKVTQSPVVH